MTDFINILLSSLENLGRLHSSENAEVSEIKPIVYNTFYRKSFDRFGTHQNGQNPFEDFDRFVFKNQDIQLNVALS